MKTALLSLYIFFTLSSYSQTVVKGTIKDSKTKKSLAFCSIAIKGTKKGTISNGDGIFSLSVDLKKDTVLFSYLGYKTKALPAVALQQNNLIYLTSNELVLQEFVVFSDKDYLYDIIEKCRKNLQKNKFNSVAKTYYGLETQLNEQSVELIECYYNAFLNGLSVENLLLKNGRVALEIVGSRLFNNVETSKAITKINLTNKNIFFPSIPLQYNKSEMKGIFALSIMNSDSTLIDIKFIPLKDFNEHFSGEIWIDKKSFSVLKINLTIENTTKHPFVSVWEDSITNVSLDISQTFKKDGHLILPVQTLFNYNLTYISASGKARIKKVLPYMTRDINVKSMLYFYDYDNPFILPYFEYNSEFSDYKKMSLIPYNNVFWRNNNAMVLTEKQKEKLGFLAQTGFLINYADTNYGKDFLKTKTSDTLKYLFPYTFWQPKKRIFLSKKTNQTEVYPPEKINQSILSELYNLKVQILLDINPSGDSLSYVSYSVFDETQTYYHLPQQIYTTVFLNIYFDICEIERRKMDQKLSMYHASVNQIDSVYKETLKSMETTTQKYLKEVKLGKEESALKKWNEYVIKNLNINNIEIFKPVRQ